jgi:hypothetical protein
MWRKSLLSLLLLWVAFPAAAEQLPIWLNEDFFGIARIEDYGTRLYEPFPVGQGPYHLKAGHLPFRSLMNCADFLAANAEGAQWWDLEYAYEATRRMLAVCYGLKYLKWARPAARSFVREDLFAGSLPDLLPANFATTVSCQSPVYALGREAVWGRLSWRGFDIEILGQEAKNRYEVRSSDGDRAVVREFQTYKTIIAALAHCCTWKIGTSPNTQERCKNAMARHRDGDPNAR